MMLRAPARRTILLSGAMLLMVIRVGHCRAFDGGHEFRPPRRLHSRHEPVHQRPRSLSRIDIDAQVTVRVSTAVRGGSRTVASRRSARTTASRAAFLRVLADECPALGAGPRQPAGSLTALITFCRPGAVSARRQIAAGGLTRFGGHLAPAAVAEGADETSDPSFCRLPAACDVGELLFDDASLPSSLIQVHR
jgi:hypothetical protein